MPFPNRNEDRDVRVFSDHHLRHVSTKVGGRSVPAIADKTKKTFAICYPDSGFYGPSRGRYRTSLNAQEDAFYCDKMQHSSYFTAVVDVANICRSCCSSHPMADWYQNSFRESLDLVSEVVKIKSGEKRVAYGTFIAGSYKAATFESSKFYH
jgi:hypothetical protein